MATAKKTQLKTKTFYRSNTNKVIAGVCGGLGEYFDIDPIIFRIIFLLLFIYGGSGILIYFILWLVIPKVPGGEMKDNVEEMKQKAEEFAGKIKRPVKGNRHNILGIILILFGVILLLDNMGVVIFNRIWQFWPLLIILLGISIISKN